jgi:hypothetical protein
MRWMLRTAAAGSFVTAATTLAVTAHPSWATDLGGLWYVMDDQRGIRATEASHARMDREAETVLGRIACKEEIVQDVLDGRLRPDEAAARFAELNRGYPPALALVRKCYPGRTDEERAARQFLTFLRATRQPAALALAGEWEGRLLQEATDSSAASE